MLNGLWQFLAVFGLWSPCHGYLMSRSSVDGVPSNLVTLFFNHPQYPLTLEILTTTTDWVIKDYKDGSQDSTLPLSIIARRMLPFLQQEIVKSTIAGESERLTYLLDMQRGWSTVRNDQLAAEVDSRFQVSRPTAISNSTTNTIDSPIAAALASDDTADERAKTAVAPDTDEYDAETVLAWALGLVCLDFLVACLIGIMICTSSKKPDLTSLLAHPARLHYTVTHPPSESLC